MKKNQIKVVISAITLLAVLLGTRFVMQTNNKAKAAEMLAEAQSDPGIVLDITAQEAAELGLTEEEAQDSCTVYDAMLETFDEKDMEFIVAFITNDAENTPDPYKVKAGSTIVEPPVPIKEGYKFLYWQYKLPCDEKRYIWDFDNDLVGFNLVLEAVYQKDSPTVEKFKVTFDMGGLADNITVDVVKGEKVTEARAPKQDGYKFIGWFDGDKLWDFEKDVVLSDITLVAKYEKESSEYSVKFNADGGTPVPDEQTIKDGGLIVKPANPAKEGFVFEYWFTLINDQEKVWNFDTDKVTSNITLVAKYKNEDPNNNIVNVKFDYNYEPLGVHMTTGIKGEKLAEIDDPIIEGRRFSHWYYMDNGEPVIWKFISQVLTGDLVLYAEYYIDGPLEDRYNVSFIYNDGKHSSLVATVFHGLPVGNPSPQPGKEGYKFIGWYVVKGITVTDQLWDCMKDPVSGDMTLAARYEKLSGEGYNVKFLDKDGAILGETTVEAGKKIVKPVDPVREGYIFDKWIIKNTDKVWNFDTDVVNEDITLVAIFKEDASSKKYTITFDTNGGTPATLDPQEITVGGLVKEPTVEPQKDGYKFIGWFNGDVKWDFSKDKVSADTTLIAKYEKVEKTYSIKFDLNGGQGDVPEQKIVEGNKITRPADPTKTGYDFTGWYNGDKEWDFEKDVVTADLKLIAKYEENITNKTFVVKFNTSGAKESVPDQKIKYGNFVAKPDAITKEGHTFQHWYIIDENGREKVWEFENDKIVSETTLIAKFKKDDVYYKVSFDTNIANQEIAPLNVLEGTKATEPLVKLEVYGYDFVGWFVGDKQWNFSTDIVNSNITLVAKFKENIYNKEFTVNFISDGKAYGEAVKVKYDKLVTKPADPKKDGFEFLGWYYKNETGADVAWNFAADKVHGDVTLVASFKEIIKEYVVKFDPNGGSPKPADQIVKQNALAKSPDKPKLQGYTFLGWYIKGTETKWDFAKDKVSGDLELVARFKNAKEGVEFCISFFTDGGLPQPPKQNVVYQNLITKPADPAKEGYTFLYWYYYDSTQKQVKWNFDTDRVLDITNLIAKWERVIPKTFTVTFDTNGAKETINPVVVETNALVARPAVTPTKDGYKFVNWYIVTDADKTLWNFGSDKVTKDITLKALFEVEQAKTYEVIFDLNGGSGDIPKQVIENGKTVAKPVDPLKDGFVFEYWAIASGNDLVKWDFAKDVVTANTTLIAKYVQAVEKNITVTFDTNGGNVIEKQVIKAGETVSKPQNPTKNGFKFEYWYIKNAQGQEETVNLDLFKPTADVTIYAKFTAIAQVQYDVTFDSKGGNYDKTVKVDKDALISIPADPIKEGYKFVGWFIFNEDNYEIIWNFNKDKVTRNITLIARWEEENLHTVTFDVKGGTPAPQAQSVKHGFYVAQPVNPTLKDKYFQGWYFINESGVEQKWVFGSIKVTKDIQLYAKWSETKICTVIFFNLQDCTMTEITVNVGEKITKIADPNAKPGTRFWRWIYNGCEWNFDRVVDQEFIILYGNFRPETNHIVTFASVETQYLQTQAYADSEALALPKLTLDTNGFVKLADSSRLKFDGWFTENGTEVKDGQKVTGDMKVIAKWTTVIPR